MAEIYDGSNVRLTLGGKTVYHAQDCNISIEMSTKERTSKDIEGTQQSPDVISWSGGGSALGVMDLPVGATNSMAFEDLFDTILAQTLIEVEFTLGGDGAPGDTVYKGQAYMTSLEGAFANREDATVSYSLTGFGVPTKDVIVAP